MSQNTGVKSFKNRDVGKIIFVLTPYIYEAALAAARCQFQTVPIWTLFIVLPVLIWSRRLNEVANVAGLRLFLDPRDNFIGVEMPNYMAERLSTLKFTPKAFTCTLE